MSIALTRGGVINSSLLSSDKNSTPSAPIVIATFLGPHSLIFFAASEAVSRSETLIPDNKVASVSFGVTKYTPSIKDGESSQAGAGSRIIFLFLFLSEDITNATVSIGISNCKRITASSGTSDKMLSI